MNITHTLKATFAIIIATLGVNNATAQDLKTKNFDQGFRLGFGINGGLPTNNTYNYSLGADARIQYDLSKNTSVTFTTGFTNLFIGNNLPDLGFIPAKVGFKAFVLEDQFYVLGEIGAGMAVTNGYNDTTFLWAPGIGYANENFDISLRYEDYHKFNTNQIALRLAYGFKL